MDTAAITYLCNTSNCVHSTIPSDGRYHVRMVITERLKKMKNIQTKAFPKLAFKDSFTFFHLLYNIMLSDGKVLISIHI